MEEKKEYILIVDSWENDGDCARTTKTTYENKEEALALKHMCNTLFKSTSRDDWDHIGNMPDFDKREAEPKIVWYLLTNPKLLEINSLATPESFKKQVFERFPEARDDEEYWYEFVPDLLEENKHIEKEWTDMVIRYNRELMGGSEYYYSRVCERAIVDGEPAAEKFEIPILTVRKNGKVVFAAGLKDENEKVAFDVDVKDMDSESTKEMRGRVRDGFWSYRAEAKDAEGTYGNMSVKIEKHEVL